MKEYMNIFPFGVDKDKVQAIWNDYYKTNSQEIKEKYGKVVFTGKTSDNPLGYEQLWSYSYFRATIINNNTIEIQTYELTTHKLLSCITEELKEKFTFTVDKSKLKPIIEQHKQNLAEREFELREEQRLIDVRKAGIARIYDELFKTDTSVNHFR